MEYEIGNRFLSSFTCPELVCLMNSHPCFNCRLLLKVNGTGVQIYRCEKSSNGSGMMEYTHVGETAKLYSPYDNEKNVSVGYQYYLPHPLAQGAQPTFSFSMVEGDPVSAIPESTVTGIVYLT